MYHIDLKEVIDEAHHYTTEHTPRLQVAYRNYCIGMYRWGIVTRGELNPLGGNPFSRAILASLCRGYDEFLYDIHPPALTPSKPKPAPSSDDANIVF